MGTGSGDPQAWARPQSPPAVLRKRAGHASHGEGRTKVCPRTQSLELVGGSRKKLRTRARMTTAPRRGREAKAPTPVLSPHLRLTTPRNPLTPPGLGPHVCKMKKPSPEWCVCVCVCVCVSFPRQLTGHTPGLSTGLPRRKTIQVMPEKTALFLAAARGPVVREKLRSPPQIGVALSPLPAPAALPLPSPNPLLATKPRYQKLPLTVPSLGRGLRQYASWQTDAQTGRRTRQGR